MTLEIHNSFPDEDKKTFVDILRWRAETMPEKVAHIFLKDGESDEDGQTYGELDQNARALAATLQQKGGKGDRVLILLQPGQQFITAYFGCLYAGQIAIPLYPHLRKKKDNILSRILNVAKDSKPVAILSNSVIEANSIDLFAEEEDTKDIPWVNMDFLKAADADKWVDPKNSADEVAFLQYTSGSTNLPKGVMVTHGNLVHNTRAISDKFGIHAGQKGLVWLPPYHDMGLIGGILTPVYAGFQMYLMPPPYFLQRPYRWLDAISRYQINVSGGPNFAYEYCVKRVRKDQLQNLQLSQWQTAFCGAEPINPETFRRFDDYFRECGFQYKSFIPCYGLAESTLLVTSVNKDEMPGTAFFAKQGLEKSRVIPSTAGDDSRELVGCGGEGLGLKVRIVNPDTNEEVGADEIGEIWVFGGSVAKGYWGKPDLSKETFEAIIQNTGEGPFMRTGDLGFMRDGQLYITGRIKELIIIDGSNHYPQDIEWSVENAHEAIRPHGVSAFSVEEGGREQLVLVAELEPRAMRDMTDELGREIRRAMKSAVSADHDLSVFDIAFVSRLPRTTSGKIKHNQCKMDYLAMKAEQ